jgi:hypothetical protein
MNCPKCNEEIDDRGVIYHFKTAHNSGTEEMIGILFEEMDELNQRITMLRKAICKSPTMALNVYEEEE